MIATLSSDPAFLAALHVVTTLRRAGHQAYFAGGCVRDLLLGIAPKDYDVATSAGPEKVLLGFPRTFGVGAHFGVVIVCSDDADGCEIKTEVATFRDDGTYEDGRRPTSVTYADSPERDVARRDFTINGMMLDPVDLTVDNLQDHVLDFVGGRGDLAAGIVRAIGTPARRFQEDKLRMLRAVRFAARLGFRIEGQTLLAIQQEAATIHQVSAERIREELTRMLTEGHAEQAFELLDETGLLQQVLPEVAAMHGIEQPPEWHPEGDVWVHTLLLLRKLKAGEKPTLAWAALLHDVGKPPCCRLPQPGDEKPRIRFNGHAEVGATISRGILNRLRFSNEDTDQIVSLVANHMRFGDVKAMRESTLRRFFRLQDFPEHLALHHLDCTSSHNLLGMYDYARERFYAVPAEHHTPAPLVTGRDLIALGLRPGPAFKQLLQTVEDAQLEGAVTTHDEAVQLLHALVQTAA